VGLRAILETGRESGVMTLVAGSRSRTGVGPAPQRGMTVPSMFTSLRVVRKKGPVRGASHRRTSFDGRRDESRRILELVVVVRDVAMSALTVLPIRLVVVFVTPDQEEQRHWADNLSLGKLLPVASLAEHADEIITPEFAAAGASPNDSKIGGP